MLSLYVLNTPQNCIKVDVNAELQFFFKMISTLVLVSLLASAYGFVKIPTSISRANSIRSKLDMASTGESIMKKLQTSCAVFFTIFATSVAPILADSIPLVGAPAPDFNLPSNVGKSISLNDLKGTRTVLYFYPVKP